MCPEIGVELCVDAARASHLRTRLPGRRKAPPDVAAKYRRRTGARSSGRSGTCGGRPPEGYFTKRTAEAWLRDVLDQAERGVLPGMGPSTACAGGRQVPQALVGGLREGVPSAGALAIRERSLAALTERGCSQKLAARAFTTLLQYVVGSAVTQAGSPAPDEAAAIRDYYRSLDAAAYPHVAAAAEALTHTPREAGFVEGLEIVLDGIDRLRRRSAR